MSEQRNDIAITLPKNIRQMGTPAERQKIYIEDYVHTYLHTFLKEKYKEDTLRAAILLGDFQRRDGITYSFVKGAIACDFSQVHETVSEELSRTREKFFPEWEVLGWYVCAQGVDGHIQSEIKHYYAGEDENIPHYLVYEDELEKETDLFVWEQNALHKLTGYYIYYAKNPQMQEFLIKEKGGRPQETPTYQLMEKPEETSKIVFMDAKIAEKKARKPRRLVYVACGVLLVILAAMGVSQIGDYQNLQQLQEAISNTLIPSEEAIQPEISVEEEPLDETPVNEDPVNENPEKEKLEEESDATSPESATEPRYYTVKKGDSLYSISRDIYENEDMVEAICRLNELTNIHLIQEGQTLMLP